MVVEYSPATQEAWVRFPAGALRVGVVDLVAVGSQDTGWNLKLLMNAHVYLCFFFSQSGATFSQNQVQRLVMRRELSRKKEEIERKMNESLIAKVVPKELQSTPDMDVKAFRIASQDEGHAILLKRRSSKENAEDLKKRLEW